MENQEEISDILKAIGKVLVFFFIVAIIFGAIALFLVINVLSAYLFEFLIFNF